MHPVVEILEPQQRADALVEGIFVGDHRMPCRPDGWPGLWGICPRRGCQIHPRLPPGQCSALQALALRAQRGVVAAVPDHVVGHLQAPPARPLRGHDRPHLARRRAPSAPRRARPAAPRAQSTTSVRATRPRSRAVSKSSGTTSDRVGARAARRARASARARIERVQDRLQARARRGVREGERAHRGAVERAVGGDEAPAPKASRTALIAAPAGGGERARDRVGSRRPWRRARARRVGHRGLARADARP